MRGQGLDFALLRKNLFLLGVDWSPARALKLQFFTIGGGNWGTIGDSLKKVKIICSVYLFSF